MLELRLLGYPSATLDGIPLSDALLHKDLALLYYLAVSRQPQPRISLAALLWGDLSEVAARGNLRKALSNLRLRLGEHIVIARDQVELVQAQCETDVWEFERLARNGIASGDPTQLEGAVTLYRGDFLAGFAVRNAADFDRWLYNMQERLRGLAVHVLSKQAMQHANAGDLEGAIAVQRRMLELEPWREEAHRELMLFLARSGQRSGALAQYKVCVEVLAAELGVEPDQETTALAAQIRDSAVPAARPLGQSDSRIPAEDVHSPAQPQVLTIISNLAPELSPIVGRAKELDELSEMLLDPECRLVTILGEGGIGKTRLAQAVAHRLGADFTHTAMISLATVAETDEILSTIGRALGIISGWGDDIVLEVLRAENPHLLLVLDNFEHLLPGGVEVMEQLLGQASRLRCLVTSREALSTRWEWRYQLTELSFPAELTEVDPANYSSVQLFRQVARRMRPRRPIEGAELGQVMRICRAVGGMPLGVELAAAQVGSLSCAAIADQVAAGIERLAVDRRDLPVRQRSLLASFDASWATLAPHEQRVLARLSVLYGEFTLEAALAIAEATVTDMIRLIDKSLVRSNGGEFYSLHEVVKRHAAHKLAMTPGGPAAVFARYRDYLTQFAEGSRHRYTAPPRHGQEAAARLENHVQHLWHLWLTSKDRPEKSHIAIAFTEAEQAYRGIAGARTGGLDTWVGLGALIQAYTETVPAYSDVWVIDIVWLPWVADKVADLTAKLTPEMESWIPAVADAYRIDGRLLAVPKEVDVGVLRYRSDLLGKYGFAVPPVTWDELEHMAAVIQTGERAAGHRDFWGFIWPGRQSESLTCTALEWQHSEGGGCIIEPDGRISIANERAAAALARAARWVGNISPPDFGEHSEYHTVRLWENGDAAFMRMWSSFSTHLLEGALQTSTATTVLPRGSVRHAATLGGWPLVVRSSLRQRTEAFELVKEMGSLAVQHIRAQRFDCRVPTIPALYHEPAILEVQPYLPEIYKLITSGGLAIRPCTVAGTLYARVSALYADTVTDILRGQVEAQPALTELERALVEMGGWERSLRQV